MIILTWISVFLLIQTSQSYVLLTANLDDIQNIVQQVVQSAAAEKVGQYVRRATSLFHQYASGRAGDDADLKESPLVRQVVNVLRSAYTVLKDQFSAIGKETEAPTKRKKVDVSTEESSDEMDNTRRRARHRSHNRHKHSRKHYPVPHRSRSRRAEAGDSGPGQKANTPSENKGDGSPTASQERREKLKETSEMLALSKNASRYLTTMKEIIENSTI